MLSGLTVLLPASFTKLCVQVPTRQYPVTVHFNRRTEVKDYLGAAFRKVPITCMAGPLKTRASSF